MEREAKQDQQEFMGAVAFALQAASSTRAIPVEVLERAVSYGGSLIKPGISLDDALELEPGLRALRPLLAYRRALDSATNPNDTQEDPDAQ